MSAKIPVIGPVVYYIERASGIKIGHAVNLRRRMKDLYARPIHVLAIEPGPRALETERHAQFAADRIHWRAETFRESPELLAWIEHLRDQTPVPYDVLQPRKRRNHLAPTTPMES